MRGGGISNLTVLRVELLEIDRSGFEKTNSKKLQEGDGFEPRNGWRRLKTD